MSTIETSIKAPVVSKEVSDRVFGVVLAVIFGALAALPLVLGRSPKVSFLWVALTFLLVATLCPILLKWPKIVWFFITRRIAAVVNFLLLAVMFYGVVTPVALFFKVVGRDPLKRKWDRSCRSYWVGRDQANTVDSSMKHQF